MQGKSIKLKADELTSCRQEVPRIGHLLDSTGVENRPWKGKCYQRTAKANGC